MLLLGYHEGYKLEVPSVRPTLHRINPCSLQWIPWDLHEIKCLGLGKSDQTKKLIKVIPWWFLMVVNLMVQSKKKHSKPQIQASCAANKLIGSTPKWGSLASSSSFFAQRKKGCSNHMAQHLFGMPSVNWLFCKLMELGTRSMWSWCNPLYHHKAPRYMLCRAQIWRKSNVGNRVESLQTQKLWEQKFMLY